MTYTHKLSALVLSALTLTSCAQVQEPDYDAQASALLKARDSKTLDYMEHETFDAPRPSAKQVPSVLTTKSLEPKPVSTPEPTQDIQETKPRPSSKPEPESTNLATEVSTAQQAPSSEEYVPTRLSYAIPDPDPHDPSYDAWLANQLATHNMALPEHVSVAFTDIDNCGSVIRDGGGCTHHRANGILIMVSPVAVDNGTGDYIFWHEYAHAIGIFNECEAERYGLSFAYENLANTTQC